MNNRTANEFNAVSAASTIGRLFASRVAGWTNDLARKAAERRLCELDAQLLSDIGREDIESTIPSLASKSPHILAFNLQLLRSP